MVSRACCAALPWRTWGQICLYTSKSPWHISRSTVEHRQAFDPGVWFPADHRANSALNKRKQPLLSAATLHTRSLWCGKDINCSPDKSCCLACLVCEREESTATLTTVQGKFASQLLMERPNYFLAGTATDSIRRQKGRLSRSVGLRLYVRAWTCSPGSGLLLGIALNC